MVPFASAFDYYAHRPGGLVVWDLMVDIAFLIDVALHFVFPYEDRSAKVTRLEYSLRPIARRYALAWFFPDIVSSIPFFVSSFDGFDPHSWVVTHGLDKAHVSEQYLNCLYWVLTTLATVGYGDISPGSNREKAVTIFMFLVGATVFAFLIGAVTGLAASLDRSPGALAFNEGALLGDLSASLRTELAIFRHKDLILKGKVRIAVGPEDSAATVATLSEGNFFGEIAALTDSVRTAHAIAIDFCELVALNKGDLETVLEDFPYVRRRRSGPDPRPRAALE
eukprot:tig00000042_g15536.t1